MNCASLKRRFESGCIQNSRPLSNWPAQLGETSATSAEYLLEECEKLFERCHGQLSTFYRLRLQKLLQRIHLRFGPDGSHWHFRRLLRQALKSLNFSAAIILLTEYLVDVDLRPIGEDTLDLLTQTIVWIRSHYHLQQRHLELCRDTLKNVLEKGAGFTYLTELSHAPTSTTNFIPIVSIVNRQQSANQDQLNKCFQKEEQDGDQLFPDQSFLANNDSNNLTSTAPSIEAFDSDEMQFERLVQILLPHSRPCHCYSGYGSLLELLIRILPSIDLIPLTKHSRAERLLRICLCSLLRLPRLDVNPKIGWQRIQTSINKQSSDQVVSSLSTLSSSTNESGHSDGGLLQLAIDRCHYDVAIQLVRLGSRITGLRLHDVLFSNNTERLFQYLYLAGHQFPPENHFRQIYADCIKNEIPFERFCKWLRKVQSRHLPLTCLAWNSLRTALGSDGQILLDQLEYQMLLPPSFLAYARFQALDILLENE